MADKTRLDPMAIALRSPDKGCTASGEASATPEMAAESARHRRPARPDPKTGEVPAGPGDAGLADRPERNAGSPGTKQMSKNRLVIGLGLAALLAILGFAVMF